MSRTYRTASIWMETRFKYGDSQYPEENESHYFNGRYQAKMRNGNHSYHSEKIDPRTYKVSSWRGYGRDTKVMAKRAARRNAKTLVRFEALIIMDELWEDLWDLMIADDWYDEDMMDFDFSYSDEDYDYAEQRRLEEIQYDYEQHEWRSTYDLYEDWDY